MQLVFGQYVVPVVFHLAEIDSELESIESQSVLNTNDAEEEDWTPKTKKKKAVPVKSKGELKVVADDKKKWIDEEKFQLIKEVEVREWLWNSATKDYHNRSIVRSGWENVSMAFKENFSGEQCNLQWQTLRAGQRCELAKLKTTKSGQGASSAEPLWIFWKAMLFVLKTQSAEFIATESNLVRKIVQNDLFIVLCRILFYCVSSAGTAMRVRVVRHPFISWNRSCNWCRSAKKEKILRITCCCRSC